MWPLKCPWNISSCTLHSSGIMGSRSHFFLVPFAHSTAFALALHAHSSKIFFKWYATCMPQTMHIFWARRQQTKGQGCVQLKRQILANRHFQFWGKTTLCRSLAAPWKACFASHFRTWSIACCKLCSVVPLGLGKRHRFSELWRWLNLGVFFKDLNVCYAKAYRAQHVPKMAV